MNLSPAERLRAVDEMLLQGAKPSLSLAAKLGVTYAQMIGREQAFWQSGVLPLNTRNNARSHQIQIDLESGISRRAVERKYGINLPPEPRRPIAWRALWRDFKTFSVVVLVIVGSLLFLRACFSGPQRTMPWDDSHDR